MSRVAPDLPSAIAELMHELRAPLGGIDAMAALLEAGDLDDSQRQIVAALRASSAHLRAIANRVLGKDAPAQEIPAQEVPVEEAGLQALLAPLEISARARCLGRGLGFSANHGAALAGLCVPDPMGLRQVLENLLDNATRLMAAGTLTLDVTPAGAGRIAFRVIDQGPGLSAEDAGRLIREGGGLDGRPGGAGLGLTIAGRIVARHGGTLRGGPAETGQGACFVFDWPAQPAGTADCLIVDDHPASRLVLRTILEAAGYRCLLAGDVHGALEIIAGRSPAVVLTDLNMPDGGGAHLIRAIGAMEPASRPRIIIVSADEIDPGAAENAGIAGAIRKPITVRAVLDMVRHVLRESARRAA